MCPYFRGVYNSQVSMSPGVTVCVYLHLCFSTHKFSDISSKKLVFQLKKDTDTTFMWKGTVRIKCHKVRHLSVYIFVLYIIPLFLHLHLKII